jgi:cytochrome oxidase assembly protein ShyY1
MEPSHAWYRSGNWSPVLLDCQFLQGGRTSVRILVKRVYDPPARSDGRRILLDRLWPRGLSKAAARIDHWA